MSKSDAYEADILKLLMNATPITGVADNTATAPLTFLSVALHTADPGETGTQATSEAAYTGYARVSVARTAGGWAISGTAPTVASPVAAITFPACTAGAAGSTVVTFFSVGPTGGGATKIFYSGAVTPNISIGNGVTPQLGTGTTISED